MNYFCFAKILNKAHTGASKAKDTTNDNRYEAKVCPKNMMTIESILM